MSIYQKQFCVEVLTPARKVIGTDAVAVSLPAADGMIGVLARHMPLVAMHGKGVLSIEGPDGKLREYFISGGFTQFRDNAMTVLAELCQPVAELSESDLRKELAQAVALPDETREQRAARAAAIELAQAKLAAMTRGRSPEGKQ